MPAALHRWAAEHNQHLSASTRAEVDVIASVVDAAPIGSRSILEIDEPFRASVRELFQPDRAQRADMLVQVVAEWASELPPETSRTTVAEVRSRPASVTGVPDPGDPGDLGAPAFLRSDRVDEDDSARIYGGTRSYVRVVLAVISILVVAGLGVAAWLWVSSQGEDLADKGADEADATTEATADADTAPASAPATPVPTPTLEPFTPASNRFWADITAVLNGGSGTIVSSTYPVSPANRAVLTGHTAAITGIAISDDGRVLTSGADRRLVDWGNDVTIASPDVLDVEAPLTMLMRTLDQKLIAGDTQGTLTVIDLVSPTEPLVISVHSEAVSAGVELADGRIAIASVDGSVALFPLDDPEVRVDLPHDIEVTALASLPGERIATASVDGSIRIWSIEGGDPIATLSTLDAPDHCHDGVG